MCGILGSINATFDANVLNQLAHRGPDDMGNVVYSVGGNKIQFGHRRLSILDLTPAGHQPMISTCNDYCLIFNGEIYNHQELRKQLPISLSFKGHCDTETVLYYLKYKGLSGLVDLNGIFSIAFLDLKSKRLILARDHFGVKPLYYFNSEDKFIFCSEIRPILSILQKRQLNTDSLATLLRLRYSPSPYTLYQGLKKIKPGHYMVVDLEASFNSATEIPFIRPCPKKTMVKLSSAKEEYGKKICEAVNRQLLSDVEVGVFLSGGVDSAVIASLASRKYGKRLKAYTVGFEGASESEIDDAAVTASYLGLDHYCTHINFNDFLNKIRECTSIVEEPLATTSIIPMYYLAELASKDVKVILTGQGADEPLGGYKKYKLEVLKKLLPSGIPSGFFNLFNFGTFKNESIRRGLKSLSFIDDLRRFLSVYELFTLEEINSLIQKKETSSMEVIRHYFNILGCRGMSNSSEKMMALDTRLNLPDDLLNYTDKISMHFSIECRVPMLDVELVEYIESLPRSLKLNLRDGKIIHKEFAKTILPNYIVNRKKKGFLSPTNEWFKAEIEIIKSILLCSSSEFARVFNIDEVRKILDQHAKGYNREKQIFLLLSIYFWIEDLTSKNANGKLLNSNTSSGVNCSLSH